MSPFFGDGRAGIGWEPVDQRKQYVGNHREPLWEPLSEGMGLERESGVGNRLTSGNADREPPGTSSGTTSGWQVRPSGTNRSRGDPPRTGQAGPPLGPPKDQNHPPLTPPTAETGEGGKSRGDSGSGPGQFLLAAGLAEAMRDAPGPVDCACGIGRGGVAPHSWQIDGESIFARYRCPECRKAWGCWWNREFVEELA